MSLVFSSSVPRSSITMIVNVRKRHNYDRIRAVGQTFGRHRITTVFHRAVYCGRSQSFTVKNVLYNDLILTYTTE